MKDSVEHTDEGLLAIMKWSVDTGDYSLTTLKDSSQKIIHSSGERWGGFVALSDQGALKGNSLIFYNNYDGEIFSADVTSGIVHTVGRPKLVGSVSPYNGRITVKTTPTHLYETVIPINDGAGTHSFIDIYDRRTEQLVTTVHIDDEFTKYQQTNTVQPNDPAFNPNEPLFESGSQK